MPKLASPYANAIAERVNGILNEEWLYDLEKQNSKNASKWIRDIITIYNERRPHASLGNITQI